MSHFWLNSCYKTHIFPAGRLQMQQGLQELPGPRKARGVLQLRPQTWRATDDSSRHRHRWTRWGLQLTTSKWKTYQRCWWVFSSLRWWTSCVWMWTKSWREIRSCRSWTTAPTPCRPEPRSSRAALPNSRTSTGGKIARWVWHKEIFPRFLPITPHPPLRLVSCSRQCGLGFLSRNHH